MPEAYGKFVLNVSKDIEASLRENNSFVPAVISEILTAANVNPDPHVGKNNSRQMGNHLLDLDLRDELYTEGSFEIKKGYVGVNISGSDWMGFAHFLVSEGRNVEFYANMSDEYGTRLKLGKNENGFVYGITLDEENLDDGAYQNFGSGPWKKFVPTQVQKYYKDLV